MTTTKRKPRRRLQPGRKKTIMTLSMDPATDDRLREIVAKMPGANLSGLVQEMVTVLLPMFEAAAEAMVQAKRDDGTFDEAKVKDQLAHWAGAQMLKLYDTHGPQGMKGENA